MIKKYEMATGTFYLQEIPILDKPSPFNGISLTTKEVDFNEVLKNLEICNAPYQSESLGIIDLNKKFISASDDIGAEHSLSKEVIENIIDDSEYTVKKYNEEGVDKVIISFRRTECGRQMKLMMDEADMEQNGFKIK